MRLDVPRRPAGGDEADRQRHGVMSASGPFGRSRLYAGTGGHADLRLGDGLARVLEAKVAAGDGRFPGTRHSVVRDASATFLARPHELAEGPDGDATWRAGFARLAPLVTAWPTSPQLKSGSQLSLRWRGLDSNFPYARAMSLIWFSPLLCPPDLISPEKPRYTSTRHMLPSC
jgi:hypothetical protein